jgi:photosystem I subunit IX
MLALTQPKQSENLIHLLKFWSIFMQAQYLLKYLSTAPVLTAIWLFIIAGVLIEFNRFFPDLLFHPLP